MNAPRRTQTPPNMTGLTDDLARALELRRQAEQRHPDGLKDIDSDATTPVRHDATTEPEDDAPPSRSRRIKAPRQAPRVADAVAMSVRVDPDEADDIDRWVIDLRYETGHHLDKAEVIRELIRLARHNPAVHRALVKRLR